MNRLFLTLVISTLFSLPAYSLRQHEEYHSSVQKYGFIFSNSKKIMEKLDDQNQSISGVEEIGNGNFMVRTAKGEKLEVKIKYKNVDMNDFSGPVPMGSLEVVEHYKAKKGNGLVRKKHKITMRKLAQCEEKLEQANSNLRGLSINNLERLQDDIQIIDGSKSPAESQGYGQSK